MEDFHHLESGHDLAHLSGLDNAPPNRTRQAGSIAHRALDSVRRPFLSPRKHTDVSRDASEYVTVTELDDLDTSSQMLQQCPGHLAAKYSGRQRSLGQVFQVCHDVYYRRWPLQAGRWA
jgi:hypothetical protein